MPHVWSAEPLNLLSPEVLTNVRTALDAGILCGIQAFYCGASSPEPCAFADMDAYLNAVEKSRPGDWFTLWSVPSLAAQNLILIRKRQAPATEDEFQKTRDWLNADLMREFIVVGQATKGEPPEATWGDYDWFERIEDFASRFASTGEFAVLPLTDLLQDGGRHRWIPMFHVVDAKRPNDQGEVPLGGSY